MFDSDTIDEIDTLFLEHWREHINDAIIKKNISKTNIEDVITCSDEELQMLKDRMKSIEQYEKLCKQTTLSESINVVENDKNEENDFKSSHRALVNLSLKMFSYDQNTNSKYDFELELALAKSFEIEKQSDTKTNLPIQKKHGIGKKRTEKLAVKIEKSKTETTKIMLKTNSKSSYAQKILEQFFGQTNDQTL